MFVCMCMCLNELIVSLSCLSGLECEGGFLFCLFLFVTVTVFVFLMLFVFVGPPRKRNGASQGAFPNKCKQIDMTAAVPPKIRRVALKLRAVKTLPEVSLKKMRSHGKHGAGVEV